MIDAGSFNVVGQSTLGASHDAYKYDAILAYPVRSYSLTINNGNVFLSDSFSYFTLKSASPTIR